MRKQAGRIHWLVAASLVAAVAVLGIIFSAKPTPDTAAQNFLIALAKHDVKALTELTYMEDATPEEIEKAWTRTVNVAGPYFRFAWKFRRVVQSSPTVASVDIGWVKNANSPGSYEENYGLPMEFVDGKWKVDVRAITRDFFPGLPR